MKKESEGFNVNIWEQKDSMINDSCPFLESFKGFLKEQEDIAWGADRMRLARRLWVDDDISFFRKFSDNPYFTNREIFVWIRIDDHVEEHKGNICLWLSGINESWSILNWCSYDKSLILCREVDS